MELTKNLTEAFNKQIQAEMWSSNLYLAMAVYFMDKGLDGCVNWMKKQAAEESEHAHKLIEYGVSRGGKIVIPAIDKVPTTWESPLAVFEHVYNHECLVSQMVDALIDVAILEKDKATQHFLQWYVEEQVEEESVAKGILDKFAVFGVHGLYCVNKELGKR
ncbi:MAG: ferritin [Tannerella sp.]|jgi:ferritin|nr:ferritin [Tannerella sp.]